MSFGYSLVTRTPCGRSATRWTGDSAGHRSDDQHRVRRRLAVAQFAETDHVAGGLLHPVAAGEAEIEQAFGHVHRNLLRAQDAHVGDARIVDGGPVVDRRRPDDRQVGGSEQFEGRLLQRALR